jgi:hypothetical protein
MMRRCACVLCAAVLLLPWAARAQEVGRDELLARAATYIKGFVDKFSSVVAEETLVQEITVPRRKRTLRSDYLFVRFPGDRSWTSFRDVFDVDGKPVRDHEERLTKLFVQASTDAQRRVRDIVEASARHNLLNIGTINHPLLVMAFLQDFYQPHFRFNTAGSDKSLGPKVKRIQFQEFQTPTIIKGNSNGDVFTRGLVWIDEDTGRIAKTELRIGSQSSPISVITLFKFDETLAMDVPAEMREWYPDGTGELRGVATYGRFRRFQVTTEEAVK